jgi:hypothetical protein
MTYRCPCFPLRRVVAHCTEVSRVRPTYLNVGQNASHWRGQQPDASTIEAVCKTGFPGEAEFVTWAVAPRVGGKTGIHRVDAGGPPRGPYPHGLPGPLRFRWWTLSTNIYPVYPSNSCVPWLPYPRISSLCPLSTSGILGRQCPHLPSPPCGPLVVQGGDAYGECPDDV